MTFNKYRLKGAYHYDWYETEDWYKYLIDRAVKFCKGSTLDIGCGEGLLANKIAENGYTVLGVDKDQDGIALAVEKSKGADFVNLDIEVARDLAFTSPSFTNEVAEYLTCLNVIEHLNEPEALLDIIRNNVTKGAIIITIDWQGGAFGEDHKHEYTMDELVDFFKEFNPKPFRYKDTEWIGVEITK